MLLPDVSPLASRNFRLLYIGQAISGFGSALTYVVLPVEMYRLTRSSVLVGMLGVAEFLPMLLVAFIGGPLADRFDRRRLLIFTDSVMALCLAGLCGNAMLPHPYVWPLFAAASALAALNAIHRPAIEAMTPQLVDPAKMTAVAALGSIRGTIAHIAGPGVAGWLAVQYGAALVFGLDAASFGASLAALIAMRTGPLTSGEDGAITWHTLIEGWRYALSRRDLLGTYLVDINAMFFGMPNALFPAFGDEFGAHNVGLLYAAGPLGAFLVSVTSRWAERVKRHGLAIAWAAGIWGLAIAVFGVAPKLWMALVCLTVAGGADMVSGIFRMTIWNQTIPARLRGRTAAIEMVSYLTGPYLGNAEAGLVAGAIGLRPSVALGGVLCMVGCAVVTAMLPEFRRYRAGEPGPAE
ncbi:MAG: MFS transporter [Bryobacteraceae bacterium]